MTYKKKTKTDYRIEPTQEIAASSNEPSTFGFTVYRADYGWRTKLIEVKGSSVIVHETTEPDTKLNALYKGERWIQSRTA